MQYTLQAKFDLILVAGSVCGRSGVLLELLAYPGSGTALPDSEGRRSGRGCRALIDADF